MISDKTLDTKYLMNAIFANGPKIDDLIIKSKLGILAAIYWHCAIIKYHILRSKFFNRLFTKPSNFKSLIV
jgi:hypothetical protein